MTRNSRARRAWSQGSKIGVFWNLLCLMPDRFRRQRGVTALRAAVSMTTFAIMVLSAYFGYTLWRQQQSAVARSGIERLVVESDDVHDASRRWSWNAIRQQLKSESQLLCGYPHLELTGTLTIDGIAREQVNVSGADGREPEYQTNFLAWGRPPQNGRNEILISDQLYRQLGGAWRESTPKSQLISLTIGRSKGTKTETTQVDLRVCGLLRRDADAAIVPISVLEKVDRWQTHKANSLKEEDTPGQEVEHDFVDAYVLPKYENDVAKEISDLDLLISEGKSAVQVPAAEPMWATIGSSNGKKFDRKAIEGALRSVNTQLHPQWFVELPVQQGASLRVVALERDDPRWRSALGQAPGFQEMLVDPSTVELWRKQRPETRCRILRGGFTGVADADAYVTPDTLQWLRFDWRELPGLERRRLVDMGSLENALRHEERYPGQVLASEKIAWTIYGWGEQGQLGDREPSSVHRAHMIDRLRKVQRELRPLKVESVYQGRVRLVRDGKSSADDGNRERSAPSRSSNSRSSATRSEGRPTEWPALFLPPSLWRRFVPDEQRRAAPYDAPYPCVATSESSWHIGDEFWIGRRRFRIVQIVLHDQDQLWFSENHRLVYAVASYLSGWSAIGDWRDFSRAYGPREPDDRVLIAKGGARHFWTVRDFRGDAYQFAGASAGRFVRSSATGTKQRSFPMNGFSSTVRDPKGRVVATFIYGDESAASQGATLVVSSAASATGTWRIGGREVTDVAWSSTVPPDHASVRSDVFAQLAFERATDAQRLPDLPAPQWNIFFEDPIDYRLARKRLDSLGWDLENPHSLASRIVRCYQLHPQGERPMTTAAVADLKMRRPTLHRVIPRVLVDGLIEGESYPMISVDELGDPIWYHDEMLAGVPYRVAREKEEPWIAISEQLARKLTDGPLDSVVGSEVSIQLSRQAGRTARRAKNQEGDSAQTPVGMVAGNWDQATVKVRVCGVVGGDRSFVSTSTIAVWQQWQQGERLYDRASGEFRTPKDVYDRRGFVAAVFYARDRNEIERLVGAFEGQGWRVRHQLDAQRELVRLAIAITALVVLFVSGAVFNGIFNAIAVSCMDVTAKMREIGVRMAHGVTKGEIAAGYVSEAAVIGGASCVAGAIVVMGLDPILRSLLQSTCGLQESFFLFAIYSPQVLWIYLFSAVVVIAFNGAGAWLPVHAVSRKMPTELLRHRT